jgi:predicted phage terminase large subunit-like protein
MFPRDCFKTTVYVIAYTLWLLIQPSSAKYKTGVNEKILISRKTYKEAKKILKEINQQIKSNEFLNYLYPFIRPGARLLDESIELKREINDKDATITLSGLDNSITGGHFTRIICDDLVNRLDRKSQVQRENTLGYCQDLINMKDGEDSQYVYVGTRWHLKDLYYHFIETDILGKYHIVNKPILDENGECIFPSRFSHETLVQLKKDTINWNSQYMLNPLSDDIQIFKPDELSYFNGIIEGERFLYYDGAEGNKDSDYTSIIEGTRKGNDLYITNWWAEKWDANTSMAFIARKHSERNYTLIVLEANKESLLKVTLKHRIKEISTRLAASILEIKNTQNKEQRIESMQPIVLDHVYFKRQEDQDKSYSTGFDQLIFFPLAEHDDAPDSLEGLIKHTIRSNRNLTEDDTIRSRKRA